MCLLLIVSLCKFWFHSPREGLLRVAFLKLYWWRSFLLCMSYKIWLQKPILNRWYFLWFLIKIKLPPFVVEFSTKPSVHTVISAGGRDSKVLFAAFNFSSFLSETLISSWSVELKITFLIVDQGGIEEHINNGERFWLLATVFTVFFAISLQVGFFFRCWLQFLFATL